MLLGWGLVVPVGGTLSVDEVLVIGEMLGDGMLGSKGCFARFSWHCLLVTGRTKRLSQRTRGRVTGSRNMLHPGDPCRIGTQRESQWRIHIEYARCALVDTFVSDRSEVAMSMTHETKKAFHKVVGDPGAGVKETLDLFV